MTFKQKLENIIKKNNSLLCVGLDSDLEKIPRHLHKKENPIFEFNKIIIDKTYDLVCAYKPNIAFYASEGLLGLKQLVQTIFYIRLKYPDIPIILDAKRADIGSTSMLYAKEAFDVLKADAVTVNPYLGFDSLRPFLERKGKGIIILCRTSNQGASDLQDLNVNKNPLYLEVAKKVVEWNKMYKNCLMVVGATWPQQLKKIREIASDMFFLIPGVGAQNGNLKNTLRYGFDKNFSGLIISASRSIIFASEEFDFAERAREEALELKNEINKYRK